jgi:predicted transposase YdaD
LAKKSKNSKNKKSDFDEFKNDIVMVQVLRRLERTKLEPSEYKHVSDIYQYEHMLVEKEQDAERQKERAERAEKAEEAQKERAERAEKAGKENTLKFVRGLLMLGKDVPYIASILELPVEEIYSLVQQIKENS